MFQVPLQLLSLAVEVDPVGECMEEGRCREEPPTLPMDLMSILSGFFGNLTRREVPDFPRYLGVSACTVNVGTFSNIPCKET